LRFEFEFEFELREKLVVSATGTAGRAGVNCFTEREKREREINNLQNTHCLSDEEREREREMQLLPKPTLSRKSLSTMIALRSMVISFIGRLRFDLIRFDLI
jgi:hypothetical protein